MTNQEALEKLRLLRSGAPLSNIKAFKPKDYIQNIYGVACEAIEKQIPKSFFQNQDDGIWECPNCETQLDEVTNYCSMCGQRLMNEEVEE